MNTIPSIFNEHQVNMTVVGGRKFQPKGGDSIDVILLDRGKNPYRGPVLQLLSKCGFSNVVSVESYKKENFNVAGLSAEFPAVQFVRPLEPVTTGEMINIGMQECLSPLVMVMWSDMRLVPSFFSKKNLANVLESESTCVVPRLFTSRNKALPCRFFPDIDGRSFKIHTDMLVEDGAPTFYPFDFAGIYDRARFIQACGYDHTIRSAYWQNVDFSFRTWLWGGRMTLSASFHVFYEDEPAIEDVTANFDYLRFYLKNIVPVYEEDHARLPLRAFWNFKSKSNCSLVDAWIQFKKTRQWLEKNKYRFKTDALGMFRDWEVKK